MALKDEIQAAPYTEDARLIPQGAPICSGRDAIAAFFAGSFGKGIVGARFTTNEVDGDDAQATEIGSFELDAALPNGERVLAAQGRYLIVWRNIAGEWRIHRDMFNT